MALKHLHLAVSSSSDRPSQPLTQPIPNPRDLLAEQAQFCLSLKYGQESASFKGCLAEAKWFVVIFLTTEELIL